MLTSKSGVPLSQPSSATSIHHDQGGSAHSDGGATVRKRGLRHCPIAEAAQT
jgi:hypothetical protein